MAFEEPTTLAVFDRSYNDKHEELRLERGEWQGKATYTLRLYWQTPEGQWRWCSSKPSTNGKYWQSLNLKAKELRELGEALIAEAAGMAPKPRGVKDTPQRQAQRDGMGAPYDGPGHDEDIPF